MSILSIISNCSERLFSYHWNFTICLLVNFFIIVIPMDCGTLMSTKKDWYREGGKSCIMNCCTNHGIIYISDHFFLLSPFFELSVLLTTTRVVILGCVPWMKGTIEKTACRSFFLIFHTKWNVNCIACCGCATHHPKQPFSKYSWA